MKSITMVLRLPRWTKMKKKSSLKQSRRGVAKRSRPDADCYSDPK
jgi:hypothetical protein